MSMSFLQAAAPGNLTGLVADSLPFAAGEPAVVAAAAVAATS